MNYNHYQLNMEDLNMKLVKHHHQNNKKNYQIRKKKSLFFSFYNYIYSLEMIVMMVMQMIHFF
jgi:nucleoside diphosphate kinase